ncbi:MAG: uL15m family ribosomal protein [Lachnospiraceae bacterium]
MPLYIRLPKRGFKNRNTKVIVGINVSALERFENDALLLLLRLSRAESLRIRRDGVKILGNGE